MALHASRKALEAAGIAATDLDLIIVGTISPDMPFPAAAAFLQAKLGAGPRSAAFDVSAACAGSLFALSIADQFIRTGSAKHVLIVGAELLTRIVTGPIAAAACSRRRGGRHGALGGDAREPRRSLHPPAHRRHPDGHPHIRAAVQAALRQSVLDARDMLVKMNGREVYKVAVRALEAVSREALE